MNYPGKLIYDELWQMGAPLQVQNRAAQVPLSANSHKTVQQYLNTPSFPFSDWEPPPFCHPSLYVYWIHYSVLLCHSANVMSLVHIQHPYRSLTLSFGQGYHLHLSEFPLHLLAVTHSISAFLPDLRQELFNDKMNITSTCYFKIHVDSQPL